MTLHQTNKGQQQYYIKNDCQNIYDKIYWKKRNAYGLTNSFQDTLIMIGWNLYKSHYFENKLHQIDNKIHMT